MRDTQVGLYISSLNNGLWKHTTDVAVYEQLLDQHGQYAWEVLAQYFSPSLPLHHHITKGRPVFCPIRTRIVGLGKLLWVDPRNATYVREQDEYDV